MLFVLDDQNKRPKNPEEKNNETETETKQSRIVKLTKEFDGFEFDEQPILHLELFGR